MQLKLGDIVLCSVARIESTSISVTIEGNGEGSIVMSEIASGRIRNLREYVAPNKKIVCKVISMNNGQIQLSLRRVMAKEREEALGKYQKEKNFCSLLKAMSKDYESIITRIKEKYEISDFCDEIKVDSSLLNEYFKKDEAAQILKVLKSKEETEKTVKKIFLLRTLSENGLGDLKDILGVKNVEIKYLGSSQFSIGAIGKDFKDANTKLENALHEIESKAKAKKIFFEIKEDK